MTLLQEQRSACNLTGCIYDIQGFSVQDGPGIRTTVFLKGCPLHCPWCHSIESQKFSKELSYTDLKCVGQEAGCDCVGKCPEKAITLEEVTDAFGNTVHKAVLDRKKCTECFICTRECVSQAFSICGKDYTVEEVMRDIRSNMEYYRHSDNGGVTVSGGECLWQPDFTRSLLMECHKLGIHTAVDTTGFVDWKIIESILPYTNLFLYDIKNMDSAAHKAVTGVPNETILENARKIAESGGKLQIRLPLIPQFNDSEDNLRKTAQFSKELGDAVTEIQVLPYHRMGTAKVKKVRGPEFPIFEAQVPTDAHVKRCVDILKEYGIKVVVH